MAEASRFWDRMADRYVRSPIADEDAYRTKLAVTQGYFRPDMEVLEFGSGSGFAEWVCHWSEAFGGWK